MNTLDTTLQNLRPKPLPNLPSSQPHWSDALTPVAFPSPGISWNPKMWRAIDKEMALRECSIYSYAPEDDPYDDEEEPTLWSFNYFFFNKARKRVCYIYLRGVSILSTAPVPRTPMSVRTVNDGDSSDWSAEPGASKRARYWLGDRFDRQVRKALGAEDMEDEDSEDALNHAADDEPRLLPSHSRNSTLSASDMGSPGSDGSASMHSESQSVAPHADDEVVGSMEV